MDNRFRSIVRSCPEWGGYEIHLAELVGNDKWAFAEPVNIVIDQNNIREPGQVLPEPLLKFDYRNRGIIVALFNALQQEGFKPESESKIEGLYESQSSHLEDLRALLDLKP